MERHHANRFKVYASAAMSDFTATRDLAKEQLRKVDNIDRKRTMARIGGTTIDYSWLKGASETYQISDNIEDFIITEVPIVTVDFPNRNLHAFNFDEVSYFDPRFGQFVYKTFVGKPTFADHANKNFVEAKGVHFDSSLRYVPGWDIWKIYVLLGYDKTKDSTLARQIEKGSRRSYSMGSWVSYFINSISGQLSNGSQPLKYPKGTVHDGRLSYDNCSGCLVEGTLVKTPDGACPIDKLKVGAIVFNEFGEQIKVTRLYDNGCKPVGNLINTTNGENLAVCTEDHRWLIEDASGATSVKETKFLTAGDAVVCGENRRLPVIWSVQNKESPVFDIEVDSLSHLYQLKSGIITHNCEYFETSSVVGPADVSAESHQLWYF